MNTKSIYTVGKCLLLLLLIFTGYACEDNDEGKENTSAPVLISCNINGTEVDLANIDSETENNLTAGTDGYVEFVFSKAMRQTQIATCVKFLFKSLPTRMVGELSSWYSGCSFSSSCNSRILSSNSLSDISGAFNT